MSGLLHSQILHRFRIALERRRSAAFPKVVVLRDLIPEGCTFEITNPVEAYRVEKLGGEEEFTRLLLDELNPRDVLYDIGACVGLVTIHAAAKGTCVVAFEPDPGFRSRLETNLRLNCLGTRQVKVLEWAVSDSEADVLLYTDGVEGKSPSLRTTTERGHIQARAKSIDGAIGRNEIPVPDVLKIDIEGAEILALRGMGQLLHSANSPRAVYIEIHPTLLPAFRSCTEEVIQVLESAGYTRHYEARRADQIHCAFRKQDQKAHGCAMNEARLPGSLPASESGGLPMATLQTRHQIASLDLRCSKVEHGRVLSEVM